QPLQHFVFLSRVLGQELAGLLGEIHEDRAGFDHPERLAAGAVMIDDRRDFVVRVDLAEFGAVLLALPDIDERLPLRATAFLEHDVDVLPVGGGERVEVDDGNLAFALSQEAATVTSSIGVGKRLRCRGTRLASTSFSRDARRLKWRDCARFRRLAVNAQSNKRLTGRIAAEHIKLMSVPRLPAGVVERLLALGDASGLISDTMDELGIPCGVIGASVLRPSIAGRVMVGPALTVRNILQRIDPLKGAREHVNRM